MLRKALGVFYDVECGSWIAHWLGDWEAIVAAGDTPQEAMENAQQQINKHDLMPKG